MADAVLVPAALAALGALLVAAALAWLVSVSRRNVTLVDSLWAPFFLLAAAAYAIVAPGAPTARGALVLLLVAIWALRLGVHLTLRNRGEAEDRRYAAMRARHEPGFAWKSLYIVFGLQAVLAWIIAAPLFAAIGGRAPPGALDALATALWVTGFAFETVGDAQLARFKADPANAGQVMDRGLWRWTRHPNYFGDACLWWGLLDVRRRRRRRVDGVRSGADDAAAAQGVRGRAAGTGHRRTAPRVPRLHRQDQRVLPVAAAIVGAVGAGACGAATTCTRVAKDALPAARAFPPG